MMVDTELGNSPSDGISSLHFSSTNSLLATSWDSSVYVYNPFANRLLSRVKTSNALLDGCFNSNNPDMECFVSGLSCDVHRYLISLALTLSSINWTTQTELAPVGSHKAAVKSLVFSASFSILFF